MVDYVKFKYPSRLQIIDNPMNLGPLRASQLGTFETSRLVN